MGAKLKGRAERTDANVGGRLRKRREALGISQRELGKACGVSYQQIQKYEAGRDRISASRLQRLATQLGVHVSYFFDRPGNKAALIGESEARLYLSEISESAEARDLLTFFFKIQSASVRRKIMTLVKELGNDG